MTLVLSNVDIGCDGKNTFVVTTPLDMIIRLEQAPHLFSTIVLAGAFAANRELESFLREFYPGVLIVEPTDDVGADGDFDVK